MKNLINFIGLISVITVVTAILAVSCTRSEPEISYGFIKLVMYQGEEGPQENFSFFIIPNDEDGFENLSELYLFHDKEQLRWKINSDDWQRYAYDGRDWIGTKSISINEGKLPRGVFRAVLVNKGGESTERNFTYDGNVRHSFPELDINNGVYNIKSQWPVNRLVCYDSSGNFISTVQLDSHTGNVSQLSLPANARTAALWAEDETNFCSAFTDVVPVN